MHNLLRILVRRIVWLTVRLNNLEERVTTNETAQQHLDSDIADIDAKFSDAIQHLKDQIAAGVPAPQLDFSKADALVSKASAEDTADTPAPAAGSGSAPAASAPAASSDPSTPAASTPPSDGSATPPAA